MREPGAIFAARFIWTVVLDDHDREIIELATISMATGILMECNRSTLHAATSRLRELAHILSITVHEMASAIISTQPRRGGGIPGFGSTDDA